MTLSTPLQELSSQSEIENNYPVYEVYWIKHPEHKDLTTEGYVGITSQGVAKRFSKHISDSENTSHGYVLHKALNKYGKSNLEVVTLCKCSYSYAMDLENSLRSKPFVGWNMAIGGGGNPEHLRVFTKTEEFSDMRSTHMKVAWGDPDYRKKVLDSRKRYFQSTPPWRRGEKSISRDVWKFAGECYRLYSNMGWGRNKCSNYLMIPNLNHVRFFEHFKAGWNPLVDEDYQRMYKTLSDESMTAKFGDPRKYIGMPWDKKNSSGVWLVAEDLYWAWRQGKGVKELSEMAGTTWHQTHKIHRNFENGWVPFEDLRWVAHFKGGGLG